MRGPRPAHARFSRNRGQRPVHAGAGAFLAPLLGGLLILTIAAPMLLPVAEASPAAEAFQVAALSAPTAADDALEAAVYSALVDQHYGGCASAPLLIAGHSIDRPAEIPLDPSLRLLLQSALDPLSAETVAAIDAFADAPEDLSFVPAARRPCRIVRQALLDSLFAFCPGGWERFAEAFPGARGYVTLSRIAFDPELTQALVYTEDHCGMWCGEGTYVLLLLGPEGWRVVRKLTLWVS